MALNLMALLGTSGLPKKGPYDTPGYGDRTGQDPDPGVPLADEIVVNGGAAPLEWTAPQPTINQDSIADEILINQAPPDMSSFPRTEASPQEKARGAILKGLPEHKGLFGMKGTLRDVLGVIGDGLLMSQGRQAMYAPRKQEEGISDALVGYGQGDPDADNAALARLAQKSPQMYQQFMQQHQQRQYQQQKAQQDQTEGSQKAYKDGASLYANALRGMSQDPRRYNAQLLARIQQSYGLPEEFTPPPTFSPDWAEPFIRQGTPVNQQENTDIRAQQGDRRLDISERQGDRRNDIAQQRANRPPAGRQPRARTDQEAFFEIGNVPEAQRTQAQKDFYKKYTQGTGSKKQSVRERFGVGGNRPATGGKLVFRNGKLVPKE